jgi:hypothetical protein
VSIPLIPLIVAQAEHATQAAGEASAQTVDIIGHVSNGEHPLWEFPPLFGINFSVTKHVFMLWLSRRRSS